MIYLVGFRLFNNNINNIIGLLDLIYELYMNLRRILNYINIKAILGK